jgi:isopentenyldiphosphate isomerase
MLIYKSLKQRFQSSHILRAQKLSIKTTSTPHMNDEEVVQQVDENDNLIGPIGRKEVRDKGLFYRSTFIFLLNSTRDKFWIHKRTPQKTWYPSHWDSGFGGVV